MLAKELENCFIKYFKGKFLKLSLFFNLSHQVNFFHATKKYQFNKAKL